MRQGQPFAVDIIGGSDGIPGEGRTLSCCQISSAASNIAQEDLLDWSGVERHDKPARLTPAMARAMIRSGEWTGPTVGLATGYAQANLVILPKRWAYDFLLFCHRNPKPCPLLDVTEPGEPRPLYAAPSADLRTDVPAYRVYQNGYMAGEVLNIVDQWQSDFVAFLLGCSFTFEAAMLRADLPVRHIQERRNVPMYITSIPCRPGGPFRGNMVVSMRPIPAAQLARCIQVTGRYQLAHGAPVHIGDPSTIGIQDLSQPDFGQTVSIREGEVPVFWACGVTPQAIVRQAHVDLMITHAPGHMFITDLRDEELCI